MSIWNEWTCPACGNQWVGGIGWDFSILGDKPRLERTLKAICGCGDAEITEDEMAKMKIITTAPKRQPEYAYPVKWTDADRKKLAELERRQSAYHSEQVPCQICGKPTARCGSSCCSDCYDRGL
jgi:hypothetical protein